MKFTPPSIENIGLEEYLNQTKQIHNNYGFDEFAKRMELNEPKTIIARAFNINRHTATKWMIIYEKELENANEI